MLHDRGKIKWQGFFMPEHIAKLNGLKVDYYKISKPVLDENQIEDMERLLQESYQENCALEVTTWKDGFFSKRVGQITDISPIQRKIQIKDELNTLHTIDFLSIANVTSL